VSSTATVIAAPGASNWVTTRPASTNPTCSGHQRAAEKNLCAWQRCHTRATPAPVNMPHTVRDTGCATNPATNAVKVSNVGAVKHDRNGTSTRDNTPGRVRPWSIGGTLFRHRRSCYSEPPMLDTSPQDQHGAPSPAGPTPHRAHPPHPAAGTTPNCKSRVRVGYPGRLPVDDRHRFLPFEGILRTVRSDDLARRAAPRRSPNVTKRSHHVNMPRLSARPWTPNVQDLPC